MTCSRYLLAGWLLTMALTARADASATLLAQLNERLTPPASGLQGRFTQRREVDFLQQPLVSSGHFRLRPDGESQQIDWIVTLPDPSVTRIRDGRVSLDGRELTARGANRLVGRLVDQLGTEGSQGLANYFTASGSLQNDGDDRAAPWRVQLTPREPKLQRLLQRVELAGGEYLQSVRIEHADGSVMNLAFSEVRPLGSLQQSGTVPGVNEANP